MEFQFYHSEKSRHLRAALRAPKPGGGGGATTATATRAAAPATGQAVGGALPPRVAFVCSDTESTSSSSSDEVQARGKRASRDDAAEQTPDAGAARSILHNAKGVNFYSYYHAEEAEAERPREKKRDDDAVTNTFAMQEEDGTDGRMPPHFYLKKAIFIVLLYVYFGFITFTLPVVFSLVFEYFMHPLTPFLSLVLSTNALFLLWNPILYLSNMPYVLFFVPTVFGLIMFQGALWGMEVVAMLRRERGVFKLHVLMHHCHGKQTVLPQIKRSGDSSAGNKKKDANSDIDQDNNNNNKLDKASVFVKGKQTVFLREDVAVIDKGAFSDRLLAQLRPPHGHSH